MTWIEGNVNKSVGNLNYVPNKGWYHKGTTLRVATPLITNANNTKVFKLNNDGSATDITNTLTPEELEEAKKGNLTGWKYKNNPIRQKKAVIPKRHYNWLQTATANTQKINGRLINGRNIIQSKRQPITKQDKKDVQFTKKYDSQQTINMKNVDTINKAIPIGMSTFAAGLGGADYMPIVYNFVTKTAPKYIVSHAPQIAKDMALYQTADKVTDKAKLSGWKKEAANFALSGGVSRILDTAATRGVTKIANGLRSSLGQKISNAVSNITTKDINAKTAVNVGNKIDNLLTNTVYRNTFIDPINTSSKISIARDLLGSTIRDASMGAGFSLIPDSAKLPVLATIPGLKYAVREYVPKFAWHNSGGSSTSEGVKYVLGKPSSKYTGIVQGKQTNNKVRMGKDAADYGIGTINNQPVKGFSSVLYANDYSKVPMSGYNIIGESIKGSTKNSSIADKLLHFMYPNNSGHMKSSGDIGDVISIQTPYTQDELDYLINNVKIKGKPFKKYLENPNLSYDYIENGKHLDVNKEPILRFQNDIAFAKNQDDKFVRLNTRGIKIFGVTPKVSKNKVVLTKQKTYLQDSNGKYIKDDNNKKIKVGEQETEYTKQFKPIGDLNGKPVFLASDWGAVGSGGTNLPLSSDFSLQENLKRIFKNTLSSLGKGMLANNTTKTPVTFQFVTPTLNKNGYAFQVVHPFGELPQVETKVSPKIHLTFN